MTAAISQASPTSLCELLSFDANKLHLLAAQVSYSQPHWHESPELIVIYQGAYSVSVGFNEYTITSPGIAFISQDEIHSTRALEEGSAMIVVQFGCGLFDEHRKPPVCGLNSSQERYQPYIRDIASHIYKIIKVQLERKNSFAILAQIYLLLELIADIALEVDLNLQPAEGSDLNAASDTTAKRYKYYHLRLALDYINRNYDQDLTLEQVAEVANMSYFHFSRMFKQFCQRSFVEYLTITRLNHATSLLRYTSLPIREVAERSGFHDYKQFSLVFKKIMSKSPTAYRQQCQILLPNQQPPIQSSNHVAPTYFSEIHEIPLNQQVLQQLATAFQLDL